MTTPAARRRDAGKILISEAAAATRRRTCPSRRALPQISISSDEIYMPTRHGGHEGPQSDTLAPRTRASRVLDATSCGALEEPAAARQLMRASRLPKHESTVRAPTQASNRPSGGSITASQSGGMEVGGGEVGGGEVGGGEFIDGVESGVACDLASCGSMSRGGRLRVGMRDGVRLSSAPPPHAQQSLSGSALAHL